MSYDHVYVVRDVDLVVRCLPGVGGHRAPCVSLDLPATVYDIVLRVPLVSLSFVCLVDLCL